LPTLVVETGKKKAWNGKKLLTNGVIRIMSTSTESERNKSVQALLRQGFHLTFSNDLMTVLSKPTQSTMLIAQVTDDGFVNTVPLGEFINDILNGNY
jgi:hypothetical protein